MVRLIRTTYSDPHFVRLVEQLDAYLVEKDGKDHAFYNQYNGIDSLDHVIVAYAENRAIACGAMKNYDHHTVEVKRMFTLPQYRGKGVAASLLSELESWAVEIGATRCVLETGKRQTEAVRFYPAQGYAIIDNYGQYAGVSNSVCFEKRLNESR